MSNERKKELRSIALDILLGRERMKYEVDQEDHFYLGIAEVIDRRLGKRKDVHNIFPQDAQLGPEDKLLAQEIVWDLIIERVITPGWNVLNRELPFFRVHSEARKRLQGTD